jgi:hypothetical protein
LTVESWDPGSAAEGLTPGKLERLRRAARCLDQPRFGLELDAAGELAPLARHGAGSRPGIDWAETARPLDDDDVIALIRLFTLAESAIPGWEAGDASPVIPLVALLKRRGAYPPELTGWIKRNTDNRFLPYGSLMDRL